MRVRLVTPGVAAQTTWHPQPPDRIRCILCHRCVQGAAHTVDSPREAQHHLTPPVPTACRVCWCCIQMAAWRRCSAVPMMPTSCWAMTWSSTLLMVPCTSRTPTTCLRFAAWLSWEWAWLPFPHAAVHCSLVCSGAQLGMLTWRIAHVDQCGGTLRGCRSLLLAWLTTWIAQLRPRLRRYYSLQVQCSRAKRHRSGPRRP